MHLEGPEGLGGEGLDDSTEEREESGVHEASDAPRLNRRQLEARYRALRESRRRARIIRGRSQEVIADPELTHQNGPQAPWPGTDRYCSPYCSLDSCLRRSPLGS